MDSLDGNVEESGSRRAGREGVDLDVGTPHELGRVGGDAVIPELHLILGDQVRGDDAVNVRAVTVLRVARLDRVDGARGGRDGGGRRGVRLRGVLWRSPHRVLILEDVQHEASHA